MMMNSCSSSSSRERIKLAVGLLVLGLSGVMAKDNNETTTITFDTYGANHSAYESLPHSEVMIWAYLSKPFALLSMMCSMAMVLEIVVDRRTQNRRGKNPIQWMLLSLAIADLIYGFSLVVGSWASGTIGNVGSQAFCNFQGFCLHLAFLSSQLSNAALSLCYLWIVRYGWQDADLIRAEKWLISILWIFSLIMAIYPIPLGLYNPQLDLCYINSDPPHCQGEECDGVRGGNYALHLVISAIMILPLFFFNVMIMAMLFRSVRKLENKTRKYATSFSAVPSRGSGATVSASFQRSSLNNKNQTTNMKPGGSSDTQINETTHHPTTGTNIRASAVNRKKSRAVAKQGIAYLFAFLVTWSTPLIWLLKTEITGTDHSIGLLEILMLVLLPLSGFFNFLVFARPRNEMKTLMGRVLRLIFWHSCITAGRHCREMCAYQHEQLKQEKVQVQEQLQDEEVAVVGQGSQQDSFADEKSDHGVQTLQTAVQGRD